MENALSLESHKASDQILNESGPEYLKWMHAGAAWRSILQALSVAAGDHSVQVVSGALVALQQVIDLLFQVWTLPVLAVMPPCCVHRILTCKRLAAFMRLLPSAMAVLLCCDLRQACTVAGATLACPVAGHVPALQCD